MDVQAIYEKLFHLDQEEQIGYQYFKEHKSYLKFIDLLWIESFSPQDGPADFSYLLEEDVEKKRQEIMDYLQENNLDLFDEQKFIKKGCNVELNNVQRYIDMLPHQHDFFEVVCALRGHGLHKVESQEMNMHAGDIVIIPPEICHHVTADPDCIAINIKIRKSTFDRAFVGILENKTVLSDYFAKTLYSRNYQNSLTFHCGEDPFLMEILLYMYAQQEEQKPYANYVIDGLITTFFSYLIQNYEQCVEISSANNIRNARMVEIESYIHLNYTSVTLKEVAQKFYLSEPYLSSLIKQQTGQSFSEIVREIRIKNARDLLLNTKMKVDDICEAVGYHDTTQFIRTFRTFYGLTPKQFQKRERQS